MTQQQCLKTHLCHYRHVMKTVHILYWMKHCFHGMERFTILHCNVHGVHLHTEPWLALVFYDATPFRAPSLTWACWSVTRRPGRLGIGWRASACSRGGGCGTRGLRSRGGDEFVIWSRGKPWDRGYRLHTRSGLGSMPSRDTGIRGSEAVRGDALVRHELDQENVTVGHDGPGDGGRGERKRENGWNLTI